MQRTGEDGSEWQQDCLASLLKLMCQLGVDPPPEARPSRSDKIIIPGLNEVGLKINVFNYTVIHKIYLKKNILFIGDVINDGC